MADDAREKRCQEPLQRKKEVFDSAVDRADRDRGLALVLTGNGTGRSSSALGIASPAIERGMLVGVARFINGRDVKHSLRAGVRAQRGGDL